MHIVIVAEYVHLVPCKSRPVCGGPNTGAERKNKTVSTGCENSSPISRTRASYSKTDLPELRLARTGSDWLRSSQTRCSSLRFSLLRRPNIVPSCAAISSLQHLCISTWPFYSDINDYDQTKSTNRIPRIMMQLAWRASATIPCHPPSCRIPFLRQQA